ncbi:MAG: CoA-binding protein [Candidatus Aenigmatarchaeota archaeon]|nr:MAG: CoA-binding protein [Candidatus Aenigmarchaeota archaeon]
MRKKLIESFLEKKNVFAVVGASRNPDKYGSKVYADLRDAGYRVYPVNNKTHEVAGERCYPDLKSLPQMPDVVEIVVKPEITEKIVESCIRLGIKKIWMQPGSESKKAVRMCKENDIDVLHEVCIMIQRKAIG